MSSFSRSPLGLDDPPSSVPEIPAAEQMQLELPDTRIEFADDAVPHLMVQLQDDLSRSRLREAFWISVVTHLLALIALYFSPKLIPVRIVPIRPAADLRNEQLTYLNLPRSTPAEAPPKTNNISDQNRMATSRAPVYHPPERVLDTSPPGAPAKSVAQAPPSASNPAGAQTSGGAQPQQQTAQNNNSNTNLPAAPQQGSKNPFAGARPGASGVAGAAAETAPGRGGAIGDGGGDLGMGARSQSNHMGPVDILADTQGVDFAPYLRRLVAVVKRNWYDMLPESVRAPFYDTGEVIIEFDIKPNGQFENIQVISGSGKPPMDIAAKASITSTDPFEPLPKEWTGWKNGEQFRLRFHYFYNPNRANALK
jgi:TonB family protein